MLRGKERGRWLFLRYQEHTQNKTNTIYQQTGGGLNGRWLYCDWLFINTKTKWIWRICYFCSRKFLSSDVYSMRPLRSSIMDMRIGCFRMNEWQKYLKNCWIFFSEWNYIWCCWEPSQMIMSAEALLPGLHGSSDADCDHTGSLHLCSISLSALSQPLGYTKTAMNRHVSPISTATMQLP